MTQTENLIADGEPLMTREQLLQFLNAAGFPISRSSLNKLCSPAAGLGPPPPLLVGEKAPLCPRSSSRVGLKPFDVGARSHRANAARSGG